MPECWTHTGPTAPQPHQVSWSSTLPHQASWSSTLPHQVSWSSTLPHQVSWSSTLPHQRSGADRALTLARVRVRVIKGVISCPPGGCHTYMAY